MRHEARQGDASGGRGVLKCGRTGGRGGRQRGKPGGRGGRQSGKPGGRGALECGRPGDTEGLLKWVEVDASALRHNIEAFRRIGGKARVMAVVKANAYGHGLLETASVVAELVDFFGVNELDEAARLVDAGFDHDILVLGALPLGRLDEAVAMGLHCVVYDEERARAFERAAERCKRPARLHIKLETGLNRQGVAPEKLLDLAALIHRSPWLEPAGLYTHFADIEDTTDHGYARLQLANFEAGLARLEQAGMRPAVVHCACSAAALVMPRTCFDLVRVGIGMYGLWPSKETRLSVFMDSSLEAVDLQPVMTWKTRVVQVKEVPVGSPIGYGCTEQATHALRLAVLPVGYYDGYDRGLSNRGQVLIRGRRAYVRGRVCMNMTMVDVSHLDGVEAGEEVVLLGRQGGARISAEFVASQLGTINYEVVTRVAAHQPRLLVGGPSSPTGAGEAHGRYGTKA